jgi:adenine-specific DNA-methyltransferase
VLEKEQHAPKKLRYPRNTDLDPQLVWRGKDEQDWSDLVAHAPPLYIQEKVQPKVLIDDLFRATKEREQDEGTLTPDLFADFNGIPKGVDKTEFYQHDQNWSNRMILGDSLQVMASLAEREGVRGKVQCIYLDPPYGIKFNSNFQWSTTSRDVKDGNAGHITREPEQVKAFRDTWRDGIHSYLTYLRDRPPLPAISSPTPVLSSSRSATKTCTSCAHCSMKYLATRTSSHLSRLRKPVARRASCSPEFATTYCGTQNRKRK